MADRHRPPGAAPGGQVDGRTQVEGAPVEVVRLAVTDPQRPDPLLGERLAHPLVEPLAGPNNPPMAPPPATTTASASRGPCHRIVSMPRSVYSSRCRSPGASVTSCTAIASRRSRGAAMVHSYVMVEPVANTEMAAAWEEEGRHWAQHADRQDRAVARHHARLMEAAAVTGHSVVLDVGCGNGQVTLDAARQAGNGSALGVDLSPDMLVQARERAITAGLPNATFEQADAQVHRFTRAGFDLAVSRFGAMFFADPVAAFTNIGDALHAGGRLKLLVWQGLDKNDWLLAIRNALAMGRDLPSPPPNAPGPFGLADPDHVRRVLTEAGFTAIGMDSVEEPIWFGSDADDAHDFLRGIGPVRGLTQDLDEDTKAAAFEQLRTTVAAHEVPEGVQFDTAAWLITAHRP